MKIRSFTDNVESFTDDVQGQWFDASKNCHLTALQNFAFFNIKYDLEENFTKISLAYWQFYLPCAIGQWNMWSPDHFKKFMSS